MRKASVFCFAFNFEGNFGTDLASSGSGLSLAEAFLDLPVCTLAIKSELCEP